MIVSVVQAVFCIPGNKLTKLAIELPVTSDCSMVLQDTTYELDDF